MLKKKSVGSEEHELEQMAKAELARLERQYRIMEGDRKAYSEEVKILLQKQRKAIAILEKEKSDLLLNLNCATSLANEIKAEKNAKKLKDLLSLHTKMNEDIAYEKSKMKEFDLQIIKIENELQKMKQKCGITYFSRHEEESKMQAKFQLENRLDVATVKLNRLLASNQKLREEIDHFLKERKSFNIIFQALNNKLNVGKRAIMDLMEQSTTAYDQREEAQIKLEALKQKGKQDTLIHGQEMKELQRKLDHDSKLHEFLGVKGQKRVMADLEAKEVLKRQQQKEALEKKIESYQSLLEQIRKISSETDIDRLAAQFLKQEEENFALFNYVNELSNELEVLQEQVEDLKKNVEAQKEINKIKTLQKQEEMKKLQEELEVKTNETLVEQKNLEEYESISKNLLKGIELAFELLRTDENPILQLLGEKVTVTSFNVMIFLSVIKKKAIQLRLLVQNWNKIKGQ